ncbi:endonuclease/exonuclease/phosphatase family protein [Bacillus sp. SM2101]|uniref:endonuclease/exonuclease/phosphatase family protein n=1 Tax=Bacillus sp. SM2101 TaxID=2805366 RepID=UPI001BDECE8F|nr:endonuclease/exonuclease/phosphatase family protein [Bacillus sp. SM2101]
MKTMSFNILADRRTWNSRKDGIINKILEIDPDIAGLQEALATQRVDLIDGLSDSYDLVEFNIPGNYDNPILIRKDYFTILDSGFVEAAECNFIRYVTWLLLRENNSCNEFYFYNNHFCFQPLSSREEQAIIQAETINQHQMQSCSNDYVAIAVGDFNSNRNSSVMQYLLDQVPIEGIPNPVNLVDTWDVANPNVAKPPTTDRGAAIDWILTLSGTDVTDATVENSDGFSDHFPVTATFEF